MASNVDDIRYFKGNQFTSTMGILIWATLALAPVASYVLDGGIKLAVVLIIVFSAMGMLISISFNYFGVSTYYLIVRNHNWFWRRRKFYFDEIKEIVFDKLRSENCLVVILNNSRKQTFRAETLKDRHWVDLKEALAQRGVLVTDEKNIGVLVTPGDKKVNSIMKVILIFYFSLMACVIYMLNGLPVGTTQRNVSAILFIIMLIASVFGFLYLYLWLCRRYDDSERSDVAGKE